MTASTAYFDEHCPEYSPRRLDDACDWIREHVDPERASLLDIGCGAGNVLEHLAGRTGIRDVAGMDTSRPLLARTAQRLGCPTHLASVTDPALPDRIGRRYDVVVLAAVLHHLVAGTRRESARLAARALHNAAAVTAPEGHLVVVEPVFTPRLPLLALFHLKRAVSSVTSGRVELLGTWNNIGPPVVAYLTPTQLQGMVREHAGEPVHTHLAASRLHWLVRLGGIRGRWDATVIARP